MRRPARRWPSPTPSWTTRRQQRPLSYKPLPPITTPALQLTTGISNSVVLTPFLSLFATTCPHACGLKPQTSPTSAKGCLLRGDDDTILLVRKPIAVASAPGGHHGHRSGPPFDDSVRIYVPLMARPWIMHACHADAASCHLGVTRTLKILECFYW